MSQPYKSGRQQNLNLGITSVTESRTVLQTIGKVGIGTTNAQNHSLFVVGTTNFASSLDPALLRPGRFELQIEVPLSYSTNCIDIII